MILRCHDIAATRRFSSPPHAAAVPHDAKMLMPAADFRHYAALRHAAIAVFRCFHTLCHATPC